MRMAILRERREGERRAPERQLSHSVGAVATARGRRERRAASRAANGDNARTVNRRILFGSLAVLVVLAALAVRWGVAERRAGAAAHHPWIVVGVDGGEWRVIERLWAEGKLPNLRRIAERGVRATLHTDYGVSPVIWTTIATGVVPERHGITDFVVPTAQGDLPVASTLRKVPAIWTMLTRAHRSVGVVGWWASWPAEEVSGAVVTDRAMLDVPQRVFPPSLLPEVAAALRRAPSRRWPEFGNDMGILRDRLCAEMAIALAPRRYDLLMVYLRSTDLASHTHWKYWQPDRFPPVPEAELAAGRDAVPGTYEAVDRTIGELLAAAAPDTNVLVVSDHGFRPAPEEEVKVRWDSDRLLERLGLLARARGGVVDRARTRLYTFDSPLHSVRKLLRVVPTGGGEGRAGEAEVVAARRDLEAAVARLTFGGGTPAFAVDAPRRDERGGADLVIAIRRAVASMDLRLDDAPLPRVVLEVNRISGIHHRHTHGILLAAGPDVDPHAALPDVRVHDVTPTLLYALGVPVADDFDGRPQVALLRPEVRARTPLRRIASWGVLQARPPEAATGDAELVAELRALGYLD